MPSLAHRYVPITTSGQQSRLLEYLAVAREGSEGLSEAEVSPSGLKLSCSWG